MHVQTFYQPILFLLASRQILNVSGEILSFCRNPFTYFSIFVKLFSYIDQLYSLCSLWLSHSVTLINQSAAARRRERRLVGAQSVSSLLCPRPPLPCPNPAPTLKLCHHHCCGQNMSAPVTLWERAAVAIGEPVTSLDFCHAVTVTFMTYTIRVDYFVTTF